MSDIPPADYLSRLPALHAVAYYIVSLFAAFTGFLLFEAVLTDASMWLTWTERAIFAGILFLVVNIGVGALTGRLSKAAQLQFQDAGDWNLRETTLQAAFAGLAAGAFPAIGYILLLPYALKWGDAYAPAWVIQGALMLCLIPLSIAGLAAPGAIMMDSEDEKSTLPDHEA